jgi:hypothetical protein
MPCIVVRPRPPGLKSVRENSCRPFRDSLFIPLRTPDLRPGLMNAALNGLGRGDSIPPLRPKSRSHAHSEARADFVWFYAVLKRRSSSVLPQKATGRPGLRGARFPVLGQACQAPAGSVLGLGPFAAGIGFVPPLVLAIEFRNILCSLSFAWGACGLWETLSRAWRPGFSSSCWFDEVNKVANMSQLPYAI